MWTFYFVCIPGEEGVQLAHPAWTQDMKRANFAILAKPNESWTGTNVSLHPSCRFSRTILLHPYLPVNHADYRAEALDHHNTYLVENGSMIAVRTHVGGPNEESMNHVTFSAYQPLNLLVW
jgi:hypothetical protein